MQNINGITALAHLTCVAATRDEVRASLEDLKKLGIENILALRSIKAVAGLYILAVVLCVLPQAKGEWQAFTLPAASSVELGTQKETVLRTAASQLEDTLEARCREELGAEVTIRIELEETAEGVQVHSLTVTQTGEAEETRDAVEELLQHTLGVSPVWDVPGGENAP